MMSLNTLGNVGRPCLKVCGVRTAEDVEMLVRLGVDAVGVNFWPKSKRYARPDEVEFLRGVAGQLLRVGVFVNAEVAEMVSLVREGLLDVVQLHGDESQAVVTELKQQGVEVVVALAAREDLSADEVRAWGADAVLVDTPAPLAYGGTGEVFDWRWAARLRAELGDYPLWLAGGIDAHNVAEALRVVEPALVDVASGSESAPGVKDASKVAALMQAVKGSEGESSLLP